MEFNLDTFLKNYKASPKLDFTPYLKLKKLKGYILLNRKEIDNLDIDRTYIKYIKESDAFVNEEYKSHVHTGGFLLKGGTYIGKRFEGIDNRKHWTHLLLKRIPHVEQNKDKKYEIRTFVIKISGNHIFYKHT